MFAETLLSSNVKSFRPYNNPDFYFPALNVRSDHLLSSSAARLIFQLSHSKYTQQPTAKGTQQKYHA